MLKVGDKLPTVKEVVAEVAINPNTVMKAYWQLEHRQSLGSRWLSDAAQADNHHEQKQRPDHGKRSDFLG